MSSHRQHCLDSVYGTPQTPDPRSALSSWLGSETHSRSLSNQGLLNMSNMLFHMQVNICTFPIDMGQKAVLGETFGESPSTEEKRFIGMNDRYKEKRRSE